MSKSIVGIEKKTPGDARTVFKFLSIVVNGSDNRRGEKIKVRIFGTFLILAFALSFASIVAADGVNKRVKFARGKTSTVVSGAVIRGDNDAYTLGAKSGQKMTVKITSVEKNAVFQIQAPNGVFLDGAGEGDDATNWSGELPKNGDYKIIVGGTRGNATYKLTIAVR